MTSFFSFQITKNTKDATGRARGNGEEKPSMHSRSSIVGRNHWAKRESVSFEKHLWNWTSVAKLVVFIVSGRLIRPLRASK